MKRHYNHKLYLNLLQSCKQFGYVKNSKGKPSLKDLNNYIYANMNKREPLYPHEVRPKLKQYKIKYNTSYYKSLVSLARQNGFIYQKVGKVSIQALTNFLNELKIPLPEQTIVMKNKRIEYSQCNTPLSKLIFKAKVLGYKHSGKGIPSYTDLQAFISSF